MKYLNEQDIQAIGINWTKIIDVISSGVDAIRNMTYAQPVKPYLRYNDMTNRIIAMPAYIGSPFNVAGIKWIASFPGNVARGKPRAHSVIILNDELTGEPISIINTAKLSGIRTAAVTGFVLRRYLECRSGTPRPFNLGIIGFGPIGQLHLEMITSEFGHLLNNIYLYDLVKIDANSLVHHRLSGKMVVANDWKEVYRHADVLITCTVSKQRYINLQPVRGRLYLNISLRDFDLDFLRQVDKILVDDWEEVCREDTDIERASKFLGLTRDKVKVLSELKGSDFFDGSDSQSILFSPMGMAVFDMSVAKHYYDLAVANNNGATLV
jgi:2,3-diaminopropionate biosynthesis protein SbnB